MRSPTRVAIAATLIAVITLFSLAASASGPTTAVLMSDNASNPGGSRADTLWIFDADFEDLVGDNAGWTSHDMSGTQAIPNHWHKDTIRINGFEHLGDSTWWCGTYNPCWRQPRGYGNDWSDILVREFPEVALYTDPGDTLILEFDQRYAIEKDYDYGYIEVSSDGGQNWTTIHGVTNAGFIDTPGHSQDWDSTNLLSPGHMSLDLGAYAGQTISIRFRFESDCCYSSQDQYNNPPLNSCLDGAWQLDNIALYDTAPSRGEPFWIDDCESPGDNGWSHEDIPATGQAGVVYERRYESLGGRSGWMMAAYDTTSNGMVDGQSCELWSPPIDITGAPALVGKWEGWFDMPLSAHDYISLWLSVSDDPECLSYHGPFEPTWGPAYGEPAWIQIEQEWGAYTGQTWLGLNFDLWNGEPSATHGVGFVLDRVRVGVPLGTGTPDGVVLRDEIIAVRPNPFNPVTTVDFNVASDCRAALRAYDVAGRFVRTLDDAQFEPGAHSVTWDGTDDRGERVASGVYMLKLEVEGREAASMKAVLLK